MIKLKILGPAELRSADGELEHSFLAGPKRLALLAYLILNRPRGMQRRDRILPLLWPEKGQKSARNSLSNLLYHIRKKLGRDILITRGTEELGIDASKFQCDALKFEKLIEEGKMRDAIELYRGDLLEGLHVSDAAPDFEQWIERERDRFRNHYGKALETLAEKAEKNGDFREAVNWWTLRSQLTPYDTRVVKRLTEVDAASGNKAEALRKAGEHAELLQQELDIDHQETMNMLTRDIDKTSLKMKYPAADKYQSIKHLDFKSVAILPFEEIGKHEDTSNFASGLHNDLLIRLSGISSLNVISRRSVLHYQNTKKPISEVAGELGAGTIVKGSIQFRSGRLRLNIQLIDVEKEKHILAETYDREFTAEQFFEIQSELALKITDSLKARLSPGERKRVAEWEPTDDLEAHRLYTYGRRQLEQRTASGMKRAAKYFRNAVNQDSEYALAWVGFADALLLQYDYGHEVQEKTLPRAEEAISRALELDPDLAEAYASLGLLHSNRHQGQAAIRELKRAVELQPSYAEAHNWLSWNYQLLGRPVKALESAKKAVNLNPLSPEAVSNLSVSYLYNGYSEKALSEALRGLELQPDWGTPAFYQGLALFDLKRYSEAKSVLHNLSAPWAGNGPLATLALCHVLTGDVYEAEIIKEELTNTGDLFATGLIEASLGNKDRALEFFQRIEYWDDWETLSLHHLYTTILGPLKKDSRFKEILNKVYKSRGAEKENDQNVSVPDKKSIAVLPFIDYMKRDELSPFAKGIQNDLITKLSRVDGLTIISGDSTRRLNFEEVSISEIALKLGVGTVIKGGIQQMADRLRLTVQLIDTQNEQIRWAETYDRELNTENLFNIQSELAEKITGSLRAELTPFEKKRVEEKPTDNLDAYLLYTQGRTHLSQRTEQSIHKSLNLFRESIKEDPEYSNAWAGLAEALLLNKWYNYSIDEELRDPMEAIQKALTLNPDLGETYCSLGIYHIYYQNGPEAIKALEKCIELQPGYSEAYNWLGWLRMIMGNPAPGIQPAERAARLDPLSPYTRVFLAAVYLANKKYQEALEESMSARKIRPEYGLSHFMEGLSLYHLEKYPEAEFALQESLKQENANSSLIRNETLATLALVQTAKGLNPEDSSLPEKFKNSENWFFAGLVEAAMNNYEKAYYLFEKVDRFGAFSTPMCRYYFPEVMGPIRKDSRFKSLKRKIDKSWGM
ncbi:MAG TPA: BTAD domain-containing putative transcriptional regulator [Balneolaceae bacterium]|nr:BTAD domain-containing putative transcriptional regulator [Balneolaceae bacterium]